MPAEFAPYYRSQDEKLYASGQPRRIEEEVLSGNGRIGIFETIKAPFYGPDGELLGLLGVSRDITERKQMEEALREERDYSDAILNSLPGVFYHYDDNLRLLRWNRNLERISGYSAEELAGITPLAFFVEEEKALVASRIKEVFEQGESQVEADYLLKDGRRIPYLFTGVRFEHNGRQGFVGVGTDIEEHKRMEEALREKTALFEAQVESSPDGILVIDRHGRKLIQNERLNKMWLLPPDIAANRNYLPQIEFAAQRTKNPTEFIAKIAWLEAHPEEVSHDEIELVDGTVLARYSAPVFDKEGHYYGRTWIHSDITDRRQAEQHIRYLATHDDLTALPNRNLIQDRIVQAIVHARRTGGHLALLYLDLDRFKVINDGYGHPFGDAVLKAAAERLVALVRDGDTVARLGGDEFLILLTDLHAAADAYLVAKKIVESLDCPVEVQERVVHLSSSIGVSVFPHDGETADALIDNADVAMYRAKELGRNTCQFFTREMSEETQRRVDLETRLRGAAASGQLQLAYQPKVDLESGCITGCEALLRWSHPELGIVSPTRFIPIAEDSGLIVPIGDWVLRAACLQAKAWLDAGLPPVCVAVNISARQFLQQDVVSWVLRTLHETGLPAAQLELELTESLIAQDVGKVITTFGQLRTAGVKLSIDDFGTGYSSLSYLKRFRVDTLKIDQSFVRDMLTDPEDATIVLAVIALAHNLGFKVIAEGVETERHCQVLRENRCDEIQGHYFSKPLPAAEFEAMLRSGKRLS
jgi:diguanylate cyclase (GGDEF)-like protein/PAS domain S-box-containing protein